MDIKDNCVIIYYSDIEKLENMGYNPIELFRRYGLIPKIQSQSMGEPWWYNLERKLVSKEILRR